MTARGRRLLAVIAGACLPLASHAQSASVSGTVALSSQLVDRGLAITPDTAVAQAAVSVALPSGWVFGGSASTELRDAAPLAETLVQASKYWRIAPDWQMQAGVAYYAYPGRGDGAFNRVEGSVDWTWRDVLTFGAAAIYPTGGVRSSLRGAADVNFHWPLPWDLALSAGAGYSQAQVPYYRPYPGGRGGSYGYHGGDRVNSYAYGHLGLIWGRGAWHVEVDRMFVDQGMRHESLAASPWVATISFDF